MVVGRTADDLGPVRTDLSTMHSRSQSERMYDE
jgi:hypothetical protein